VQGFRRHSQFLNGHVGLVQEPLSDCSRRWVQKSYDDDGSSVDFRRYDRLHRMDLFGIYP